MKAMRKNNDNRKAASIFEYAVFTVVLVAALLAMQAYISRALQGKHRQSADSIGEQYDALNTSSDIQQTFNSTSYTVIRTTDINGTINSTSTTGFEENNRRWGNETVGAWM
jgi:hypothetical protein